MINNTKKWCRICEYLLIGIITIKMKSFKLLKVGNDEDGKTII